MAKFITAAIVKSTPALRSQEDVEDPKVTAKWFSIVGNHRWYMIEYDPKTKTAFGFVTSSQCPTGELGYFDIAELENMKQGSLHLVERDLYWTPCPISKIQSGKTY